MFRGAAQIKVGTFLFNHLWELMQRARVSSKTLLLLETCGLKEIRNQQLYKTCCQQGGAVASSGLWTSCLCTNRLTGGFSGASFLHFWWRKSSRKFSVNIRTSLRAICSFLPAWMSRNCKLSVTFIYVGDRRDVRKQQDFKKSFKKDKKIICSTAANSSPPLNSTAPRKMAPFFLVREGADYGILLIFAR